MPSGFQEPFSGQEYELYRSQKLESATSTLTAQQRKIDPIVNANLLLALPTFW